MPGRTSPKQTTALYLLELLGKPVLFLFTILGIFTISYLHLLKQFTRRLIPQYPSFTPTTISLPPPSTNLLPRPTLLQLFLTTTLLTLGFSFYWLIIRDLPDPHLLHTTLPALSTKIYDRHDNLLYQIYRDENRTLIKLEQLPHHLVNATIASEDKSFYRHHGISLSGILRASQHNLSCAIKPESCTSIQGGSTLTQQLVKNAFLSPEKTLQRKLKEIVLALWTETIYTKSEILELYFNYVPYGGPTYGVEEASQYYFGHSVKDLTVGESALLAGLPIAPTTFSPFGNQPYLAVIRQHSVLRKMYEQGYLAESSYIELVNTPLVFHPPRTSILAPHFVMYIQELLVNQFGEEMVYRGGLQVKTTLDLSLQRALEQNIESELSRLTHLNVNNGAGVILHPSTGDILAMVGSRDFFDTANDGQVNVTLSPRQPGSAIKPLTYALAFANGYTPATRIEDTPICFRLTGSPDYCPQNYDSRFHGSITLRSALANSYNVPAIKLLNSLGVNNLVKLGQQMGITSWDDPSRFGLALTLGGGEVTLLELSQAYSVFANKGSLIPTRAILSVKNHATLPDQPPPSPKQVLSPEVAFLITNILSDNNARAPAFGANSVLNLAPHQIAVKTGTSNDLRDNWTIGYTQDYLVGIWVGNNDNAPMSQVASGITGASPIWASTMRPLLPFSPPHQFTTPDTIVAVNLSCSQSAPRYEYFLPGTAIQPSCNNNQGKIPSSAASTSTQ